MPNHRPAGKQSVHVATRRDGARTLLYTTVTLTAVGCAEEPHTTHTLQASSPMEVHSRAIHRRKRGEQLLTAGRWGAGRGRGFFLRL